MPDELMLNIPNEEIELVDAEEVEELSLSSFKKKKDQLASMRQQVMLRIDQRKLQHAEKIMDAMELTLDKAITNSEELTSQDMKFLAEAYDRYANALSRISRLDTVDGNGTAGLISLEIRYTS